MLSNDLATDGALLAGWVLPFLSILETALAGVAFVAALGVTGILGASARLVHRRRLVARTGDRCLALLWWSGSLNVGRPL